MKQIFLTIILFLLIFYFTSCNREALSEKEKIVYLVMDKAKNFLKIRYNLSYVACGGAVDDHDAYRIISLQFDKKGKITKDEGRRVIIDCLNVLLNEINFNTELKPFLKKKFSISDIGIVIFVFNTDGSNIFYPDISAFSGQMGKINYYTHIENNYAIHTKEQETYEEALQIIETQNKIKEIH